MCDKHGNPPVAASTLEATNQSCSPQHGDPHDHQAKQSNSYLQDEQSPRQVRSLDELLDRIQSLAKDDSSVSIGDVMDSVAGKSFGPLLIAPGLLLVAPGPADIPGVPIILAIFVIFISVQLLLGHDHFWIPQWLERRSVRSDKVNKVIGWLRKPARWLDHVTRPRHEALVNGIGKYAMAIICISVSALAPAMAVIPLSANVAGAAIAAFGLAILSRDGLVAGIGIAITFGVAALVGYSFLA